MIDFLSPDGVMAHLKATSKKQALHDMARLAAAQTDVGERVIFDTLIERERLGTTGIGRGVAIPHGRLKGLDGVTGIFARLERPVDFESIDAEPVDLIFLLLAPDVPGADHLKALARISRILRDEATCEKLRGASGMDALYAILTAKSSSAAA